MEVFQLSGNPWNYTEQLEPNVTAVGFFDGVHKGHQQVIDTAKDVAVKRGIKCAVMTFSPHPSVVLKKDKQHARYITPLFEKKHILEEMGIDYLFVVTFDQSLANLSPQAFVDDYFGNLKVEHVVAGFDFSYGYKGKGSMDTLPEHARGRFDQTVIEKVERDEDKISSSRIRILLDEGKVDEVAELLGRYFKMSGVVIEGEQRGRTIGFPTANVDINNDYYSPKPGVYAISVVYNKEYYFGMANLGTKPTFQDWDTQPKLEVFLFDFGEDLYGEQLDVFFHQFVREEEKFNGVDELKAQLNRDERHIREFFHID